MHTLSLSLSLGWLLATCTPSMVALASASASASSSSSLSSSSAQSAIYSSSSSSSFPPFMTRIGAKMNGIRGNSRPKHGEEDRVGTSTTQRTANHPRHFLQDWTRARCGPTGNAMWAYQGALYDPLDGKQIAQVQGLELVRCLSEADDDTVANKQRYRRRCGDLSMADILSHGNATFDYASTILTRRLFLYTPVSSDVVDTATTASASSPATRRQQILREIRLRPGSPMKKIPSNQAAAVYDTASTVVSRNNNPTSTGASEWLVHSEFSNGRSIWSTAQSKEPIVNGNLVQTGGGRGGRGNKKRPWSLEFMVYARPRFNTKQLPDLTTPPPPLQNATATAATTTISPGRAALIQFGQSAAENQGRFGVRETYHYTMGGEDDNDSSNSNISPAALVKWFRKQTTRGAANDDTADSWPSCSVRYTRYGEGPPWYGPHRMCTLELTGKRIRDSSQAPALAARFAAEQVPGFLSVHAPIPTQDSQAARAVDWFRGKGSAVLQITPGDNDERNNRPVWMRKIQDGATSVVDRVREATAISIGGNAGN
jgi:hypothetical protein